MFSQYLDRKSVTIFAAFAVAAATAAPALASEKATHPNSRMTLAAADTPFEAAQTAWTVESADASDACRPIRRLGGKVRIARRGSECDGSNG